MNYKPKSLFAVVSIATSLLPCVGLAGTNEGPIAMPDVYFVKKNGALEVDAATGVLANDFDADGDPLAVAASTDPKHGTLSDFLADGSFEYQPNADFTGVDTFSYQATDGTVVSPSVNVTVVVIEESNRPPIASPDVYWIPRNGALNEPDPGVLGNDYDPDGDSLAVETISNTVQGVVIPFDADGGLTYIAPTGFTGADLFTYQVNDGRLNSAFAYVTIYVGTTFGEDLLVNGSFEETNALLPTGWTARRLSKDRIVRNVLGVPNAQPQTVALHGQNAFRFKGGTDEKSRLLQHVSTASLVAGDQLTLSAGHRAFDAVGECGISVIVEYPGKGDAKIVQSLSLPAGNYDYRIDRTEPLVLTGTPTALKVKITNKSTQGFRLIDAVSLTKNGDFSPKSAIKVIGGAEAP
ncbi:MAG: hypothetical protein AMXMBFR4_27270 [Candidatus Hydrogenedentota bacterium]